MQNLSSEAKKEMLNKFGQRVIAFRDINLNIAMKYATGKSINPIKAEQYKVLAGLNEEQYEAVCDLLSETITSTIFEFLNMFEERDDEMEIIIKKDGNRYNMVQISEKMGSEIACYGDNGWIQKYSKIGRFIL